MIIINIPASGDHQFTLFNENCIVLFSSRDGIKLMTLYSTLPVNAKLFKKYFYCKFLDAAFICPGLSGTEPS